MHCVVQTEDFVKAAKTADLSDDEVHSIVSQLSANPRLGDLIVGTGGARKWRVPAKGKGKSGGARVVSFFAADDVPVFLLDVYSKGDQINLSQKERNQLKTILGDLAEDYRASERRKVSRLSETGS